jgi:general secretion pathway protein D
MNKIRYFRILVGFSIILSLLSPTFAAAAVVNDGKKHFKQGVRFEEAEQWDKAAEEYSLAVAANPKNPEYRLRLIRSLFNASQMFMKRGTIAANEKDYEAAYTAFRRAYAFDPTNELARSEMERMVRLIKERNGDARVEGATNGVRLVQTGMSGQMPLQTGLPQKLEKLRDVPFPGGVDLQFIIKELARELDLNVLFDIETFRTPGRKTSIDLKNVTAAKALDYIFLQEGLFFQRVGPRTILVANQTQRTKFQQLVLRTFYLANASPKDVAKVVQTAIPPQPGRSQTIVLQDDATNSVTIRDTEENVRLIGQLIRSLDKDRAEVVMDVAIYEVNKTDLLQLGNQIGTQQQLTNLGGSSQAAVGLGGTLLNTITGGTTPVTLPTAVATGILLPTATLQAFQSKNNTKLIASTQIHAFNNEDSSARIGQRVPVQSAQFVTGTGTTTVGGVVSNVINYEQVGLTLKFKPLVFPNQDVQVAMEIESKDVAGASTLTPTFTERSIKGTARVQNNKTLLLASVAQGVETRGRQGLPLVGLIPVLGRLFTAPTKDNRQVDIVIAITPRVIRAPAILPDDEVERPTGSIAVPTNNSLEAMLIEEERNEMLAAARSLPQDPVVQLPDAPMETPVFVRQDAGSANAGASKGDVDGAAAGNSVILPIDAAPRALELQRTSQTRSVPEQTDVELEGSIKLQNVPVAMTRGQRATIAVSIASGSDIGSAVIGLKFDPKKLAVRGVSYGDVFGPANARSAAIPFLNQNGKMYVTLTSGSGVRADGDVAFVEIEALIDGAVEIAFDRDIVNLMSPGGKNFKLKYLD